MELKPQSVLGLDNIDCLDIYERENHRSIIIDPWGKHLQYFWPILI